MAEQLAINNFSDIFYNLKRRLEITDCKWSIEKWPQNTFFELKCRTQIQIEKEDYNKYCDKWVDEFSSVTDTVWVSKTSNTGPIVKFRKQYQCWTHQTKEIDKNLLFDPRRCRGTINIKILGDGSSVRKNNRFLRLGMNALIEINFQHLHWLDTNQDYSFFVHWCKPLPEAPKPAAASSNKKISELVSKVLETAPLTVQKAAKRAKEVLERQCGPETSCSSKIETDNMKLANPATQVIVATSHHVPTTSENVYYVHQVVFDSATQTIREVVPDTSSDLHNLSADELI